MHFLWGLCKSGPRSGLLVASKLLPVEDLGHVAIDAVLEVHIRIMDSVDLNLESDQG